MQSYMHCWSGLFFSVFLSILFDAALHSPLDTLVFSLFLCILFYAVLHAPLDTRTFSVVFFFKYVLCGVTCTVGHTGVFTVLYILLDPL